MRYLYELPNMSDNNVYLSDLVRFSHSHHHHITVLSHFLHAVVSLQLLHNKWSPPLQTQIYIRGHTKWKIHWSLIRLFSHDQWHRFCEWHLWSFLMNTLMDRMGMQCILPTKLSFTTDIMLNIDSHSDGDIKCRQTLRIYYCKVVKWE